MYRIFNKFNTASWLFKSSRAVFFCLSARAVTIPKYLYEDEAQKAAKCRDCVGGRGAAEQIGVGGFVVAFVQAEELYGGEAIVEDVKEGRHHDVAGFVVDDAEHDAEREGIKPLCKVEVQDAECQCRDDDCRPWLGSPTEHLAFDGFATEEFFGNRPGDDKCEHSPDVVRQGEHQLSHHVGEFHVLRQDGDAECHEYACGNAWYGASPVDGGDVGSGDDADVTEGEVANHHRKDVHRHQGECKKRNYCRAGKRCSLGLACDEGIYDCFEIGRHEHPDEKDQKCPNPLCQNKYHRGQYGGREFMPVHNRDFC